MAPSHLTRGAWIEIMILSIDSLPDSGRTSHEVRGLKFCSNTERISCIVTSHLTRGAWIEIVKQGTPAEPTRSRTSHEVRGLK